jgi:hypothetical protein
MRDRPAFDLFLISWLILFLELACIRWFPSHVLFLTFFTNIVLLAGFVGMSIGCLAARSSVRHIDYTPAWLVAATAAGVLVEFFRSKVLRYVAIGDQSNPDEVFFGAEATYQHDIRFRVPVEVIVGLFFVLIAAAHVGPGQEMGRAFGRVAGRSRAYSLNLLGSLAGIASFATCSYLEFPPPVWFLAVALGIAYFIGPMERVKRFSFLALAVLMTLPTSGLFPVNGRYTDWSQYYRVDFWPKNSLIETNLISHQKFEPKANPPAAPYSIPYLFQRDLKTVDGRPVWPAFQRILIIGAGSGNDVVRAVQWASPDARIDAVEIDPVIRRIGAANHPDDPYATDRVAVHLTDGRNFLRRAEAGSYDLVIFALVDSLVLHSGYSNLRLESYLFTRESFGDVARVLKPSGLCVVYNAFRQGWLVARLRDQLRAAFDGVDPVTLATPAQEEPPKPILSEIRLDTFEPHGFTTFFAGRQQVIQPLRDAFSPENRYWFPWGAAVLNDTQARFGPEPPAALPPTPAPGTSPRRLKPDAPPNDPRWLPLFPATVEESDATLRQATDDWPFLYVRTPTIPMLTLRGAAMVAILSVLVWMMFRPRGDTAVAGVSETGLVIRSAFLGAGFMLVETKAVVQMALLFGGTWMVNTVVFAAVLLMSLMGNLFAAWAKPRRLELVYLGLFASLAVGLAVPMDTFLGLERGTQVLLAAMLVFAPIAFAGVIFATSFGRSVNPERVFGANVLGALIGGLSENASVVLGFRYLLIVAFGFYALSAAFGNRTMPDAVAKKAL